jgi:hypothetical protein
MKWVMFVFFLLICPSATPAEYRTIGVIDEAYSAKHCKSRLNMLKKIHPWLSFLGLYTFI